MQIDDRPLALFSIELLAAAAAAGGEERLAAVLLGATEAAREAMGVESDEDEQAIRAQTLSSIDRASDVVAGAWAEGRALSLDRALELARSGD